MGAERSYFIPSGVVRRTRPKLGQWVEVTDWHADFQSILFALKYLQRDEIIHDIERSDNRFRVVRLIDREFLKTWDSIQTRSKEDLSEDTDD